jgi:Putative Ig domain
VLTPKIQLHPVSACGESRIDKLWGAGAQCSLAALSQSEQLRSQGDKMNTIFKWLAALTLLLGPMVANASSYTYELNGIGTLRGFITTDCNNCVLAPKDFIAWSVTSTGAKAPFGPVTSTSSVPGAAVANEFGTNMMATPAAITFNFGGYSIVDFTGDPTSRGAYIEFAGANTFLDNQFGYLGTCISGGSECDFYSSYQGVQTIATVVPTPLTLTCPDSTAQAGFLYTSAVLPMGGIPPFTFSNTGTLPRGLALNTRTGGITGTPTKVGTFNFALQVTHSSGPDAGTVTRNCTITVSPDALLAKLLKEVTGIGPGNSLAYDIALVQTYYAANDKQATCAVLTGFVNEVKAQNGRKIAPTLDAQILSDAHTLEVAIGCNCDKRHDRDEERRCDDRRDCDEQNNCDDRRDGH